MFLAVVLFGTTAGVATAFLLPASLLYNKPHGKTWVQYTTSKGDAHAANVEDMRRDIEAMREEARQRLEKLNQQLHQVATEPQAPQLETPTREETKRPLDAFTDDLFEEEQETQRLYEQRRLRELAGPSASTIQMQHLLDKSRWRLMLNIGREAGTWMPKTWGVSGDRLLMHLELEFSSDPLAESDDFLNGMVGAKELQVHNEATVAPCMQEGGKRIIVKNGGWRVAPGEGPMGTSVLRFYFELQEVAQHKGSDVYCPLGRVYCTCGYFPMEDRMKLQVTGTSRKDVLKKQIHDLEAQYEGLQLENDTDNHLISWDKMRRSKQMMDLRVQASKLNQQMNEAHVQEPDKALLRLSQDQSVGLTREGGVCCKVHKGLAMEYHILGKFEIASMSNREHSDYRELLP